MASVSNDFSTTNFNIPRAQAREFAQASKKDVANMAVLQYSIENQDKNVRYNKRLNRAMNSLPVLAVASGLMAKKGVAASLGSGVSWGLALLAPDLISGVNRKLTKANPNLKRAEEKHPTATFLAGVTASIGTFLGASVLLNKGLANKKVQKVVSSAVDMVKDAGKSVKNSKFVSSAGAKFVELKSQIASSKVVKPVLEKINNSAILKDNIKGAKSLGKKALKYLPELTILAVGASLIAKSIKTIHSVNNNKKVIEEAQLQTANKVIDSYEAENEELRNIIFPQPEEDA